MRRDLSKQKLFTFLFCFCFGRINQHVNNNPSKKYHNFTYFHIKLKDKIVLVTGNLLERISSATCLWLEVKKQIRFNDNWEAL